MKRPTLEYIGNHTMKDEYISQLEKYCDELEKKFHEAMKNKQKEFIYDKNDIFGKYCWITEYKDGTKHLYKCIQLYESNTWMDIPICPLHKEIIHDHMEQVVRVIHCGICENKFITVAFKDIEIV